MFHGLVGRLRQNVGLSLCWVAMTGLGVEAAWQDPASGTPASTETTPEEPAGFRLPDQRLGMRVAPILLLSRDDVQKDLKLDPYQQSQAQQAIGELYEQAAALRGKTGPEVVAARRQVDQACHGWLQQWLSEEQRTRLDQVDLQWEGPSALLSRPTIAASLEIQPEQQKQLAAAHTRRNQSRQAGGGILACERQFAEEVLTILDSRQQERWKAMLGPVFEPKLLPETVAMERSAGAAGVKQ